MEDNTLHIKLDKMLDLLEAYEVKSVVRKLTWGNDSLTKSTVKIAEDILAKVDSDVIADDLFHELDAIDVEELWNNSGKTRYGYVDPDDKAWEMFKEVLEPYIEKIRKSLALDMTVEAKNYCLGILKGLQRYEQSSDSEFSDWVGDAPSEFMNEVMDEWQKGNPDPKDIEELEVLIKRFYED